MPAATVNTKTVQAELPDVAATAALAGRIAAVSRAGDVIGLTGPLGAGKTTFARAFIAAIARAEGADEPEVPSPTFTLAQAYEFSRLTVHHFDLYRVEKPEDAYELGIEDAFADGVSLIEWPERLGRLMPRDGLDVALGPGGGPGARVARLTPSGDWPERIKAVLGDG